VRGWVQQLEGCEWEPPRGVIGIVVAKNFPDPELIREKIEEGIARVAPDTVWVMRNPRKKNDAMTVAWDVLEEHGIEPLLADSNTKYWGAGSSWRDNELMNTCERVIVFHDTSSPTVTEVFVSKQHTVAKIFKIERGKAKPKPRKKGRKPTGADERPAAVKRDEGIARAAAGSDPQWKLDFEAKVREFAARREPFTYEDVLSVCPPPSGSKAQGCAFVMTRCRKAGVIEWTGKVVPATRTSRNVGDMKVWVGA